ncbi:DUF6356 family protein [Microbulbifer harenosus]|uniref:DUF6356 family protein n=1 Tax=Microbulbifer harenosus TaxID=2576840 RepID=UPI001C70A487
MLRSSREHLKEVEESYFEHQSVAFRYGWTCLQAAIMAFIHGVIPGAYKTGASDLVKRLSAGRRAETTGSQIGE